LDDIKNNNDTGNRATLI